jgi:hypothetical protein
LTHSGPEPDDDTAVSGVFISIGMPTSVVWRVSVCFAHAKPRERDTTGQLIGDIDQVISVLIDLVNGTTDWADACRLLPAYDGIQAVD